MGKKRNNTPRRKRFNKNQRLLNAKINWLPTANIKNLAKLYSKWYGVDLLCAIHELEILGQSFSQDYKQQVKASIAQRANEKRRRKEEREKEFDFDDDYDDTYSFIAGYTENGVPFGITWEEEKEDDTSEEVYLDKHINE